jgi:hypothetical protein
LASTANSTATGRHGPSGHQLVTPIGRLDFLRCDHLADALIVVELKRGRPSDKVVGQVARYIGYVRTHLAKPDQPAEGLIIHEADKPVRPATAPWPHGAGFRVAPHIALPEETPVRGARLTCYKAKVWT